MDNEDGGKGHEPSVDKKADNAEILRRLAEKLGKHEKYVPKPPGERASEAECERVVRTAIPPEAGITAITFSASNGEVTIVAERPGLAIGRLGAHLKAIREQTGWRPIFLKADFPKARDGTAQGEIPVYSKDSFARLGKTLREQGCEATTVEWEIGIVRALARQTRRPEHGSPGPRPRTTQEAAERVIRKVMPPGAGIASITFDGAVREVTVVATRPGLAIGWLGVHLQVIRWETGWKPVIIRPQPGEYRE